MPRPKKIKEIVETPVIETEQVVADLNPIIFRLKDGSVRTFTIELHGEGYKAVAAEFAETNKKIIVS